MVTTHFLIASYASRHALHALTHSLSALSNSTRSLFASAIALSRLRSAETKASRAFDIFSSAEFLASIAALSASSYVLMCPR